jgi:hypothetical protein
MPRWIEHAGLNTENLLRVENAKCSLDTIHIQQVIAHNTPINPTSKRLLRPIAICKAQINVKDFLTHPKPVY